MSAYNDGFNDGYCRAMTKVDELKDQLSTLKAILEKKDEALKTCSEGVSYGPDGGEEYRYFDSKLVAKALSLTPETYVKEGE